HCPRCLPAFPTRRSSDLDAGFVAALKTAATVGAAIGAVLHLPIDPLGRLPSRTRMAWLGAGTVSPLFCRGLLVDGNHARGGRGGDRKSTRLNSSHVKISY